MSALLTPAEARSPLERLAIAAERGERLTGALVLHNGNLYYSPSRWNHAPTAIAASRDGWLYVASGGWYGHTDPADVDLAKRAHAALKERGVLPTWPGEWVDLSLLEENR